MKMQENVVNDVLNKLKKRNWIELSNGMYNSVSPKLVITNEVNILRRDFMEKIEKLKTEVLPCIETIYVQNNHVKHDENLDLI